MRHAKSILEKYIAEFERVFIACVLWGALLTRRSDGPKAIFVSFVLFVFAFLIQTLLFGRRHLAVDQENKDSKNEKIQIYLMGFEESSQLESQEEKSFFNSLSRFRRVIKSINYCLFGLFIYLSLHFSVPVFDVPTLLFVLLCLIFSQVASLFQYLVPLGLSGFSVIYFQSKNDKPLDGYGMGYLCLFVASLVLHRRASGSLSFRIPFLRDAQMGWWGQLKYALRSSLCFLGVFFVLDYLLPNFKTKQPDPLVRFAKGVSRAFASASPSPLNNTSFNRGGGGRNPAASPSLNPELLKALSRKIADNQALMEKLKGLSAASGNRDISELLGKLELGSSLSENEKKSLGEWAQNNLKSSGPTDGDNSQLNEQDLKGFAEGFSKDKKALEKIENELKEESLAINSTESQRSGSGNLEKITSDQALETIQRIKQNQETSDKDFEILDRALANTKKGSEPAIDLKSKIESENQSALISERNIERLVGFLKVILLAVAVGFIVQLIIRLMTKPKAENEEGPLISDSLKEALKKKLNALKKRKMSARLEVIVYYNLFLSLMGYTEYSRHPSLPPDNYRSELEPIYPRIKNELEEVTRIFSDAFYGSIDIRSETLSRFRSSIRHIFKVILYP